MNILTKKIPTLAEIRAERDRRAKQAYADRLRASFAEFVKEAWPHADPYKLVWGPHLDAMCVCLQAVTEEKIKNLLINIPPGHAKSLIVSVLWPAWVWTHTPQWQVTTSSYEQRLVMRDAVKSRQLLQSEWYGDTFLLCQEKDPYGETVTKEVWSFQEDQNTKMLFRNTAGGLRQGTSVGLGTGYRADSLIVDDPLSVDGADSDAEREAANEWFFTTMVTRFNDMDHSSRVVIMQRLHEEDVSGAILAREGEDWQHLCLPSNYDPANSPVVKDKDGNVIFKDWRTVKGQLLFDQKFSAEAVAKIRKSLGPYKASGQLDQRPSPMGGGVLKTEWLNKRWLLPGQTVSAGNDPVCGVPLVGMPIPVPLEHLFLVTDAAFKGTEKSDKVAIGVWAFVWPNIYLLDLIWDRLDFNETCAAIRSLAYSYKTKVGKWKVREILIEDAANGAAIINTLKSEFPGVSPIKAEGSKVARILAGSPYMASGNVIYPAQPLFTPSPRNNVAQLVDLIGEAAAFPKGKNDDGIDMQAYAINKFLGNDAMTSLQSLPTTQNDPAVKNALDEQKAANVLASLPGLTGPQGL